MRRLAIPLLFALLASPAGAGERLSRVYPATLDWVEGAVPRHWTSTADDVWRLRSFEYSFGGELDVELGRSHVVFGVHEGNVVWAVVLPDEPAPLRATSGGGGAIRSLFLRFNPALVDELFPSGTVTGRGPANLVPTGKRVFAWKINASWQSGNQPVIPWKRSIVVDVETDGGRRFYSVDTEAKTVKYEPFFEAKPLPVSPPVSTEDALAAFDATWEAFDAEYPGFVLHPDVDWDALRETWRAAAAEATTAYEAAAAIGGLLDPLDDLHAWVTVGDEAVPLDSPPRPLNASYAACQARIGGLQDAGGDLVWGRTSDGLGYVNVHALRRDELPDAFDAVLEQLADTTGLVFDLRFNGGGNELLARRVAGRFLAEPVVYATNRYRNGPGHDDLGPVLERTCEPRGPWRYAAPVVVLQGRRTMSSAESFVQMLAEAPGATTLGDRTAGSSGNPRRLELPAGIAVNLPRWLDMDADGSPIEHVGIPPDVEVPVEPEELTDASDPVLERALELLRDVPEDERAPARRDG